MKPEEQARLKQDILNIINSNEEDKFQRILDTMDLAFFGRVREDTTDPRESNCQQAAASYPTGLEDEIEERCKLNVFVRWLDGNYNNSHNIYLFRATDIKEGHRISHMDFPRILNRTEVYLIGALRLSWGAPYARFSWLRPWTGKPEVIRLTEPPDPEAHQELMRILDEHEIAIVPEELLEIESEAAFGETYFDVTKPTLRFALFGEF